MSSKGIRQSKKRERTEWKGDERSGLGERLKAALGESAAYRAFYRRAELQALIPGGGKMLESFDKTDSTGIS